MDLTSYLLGKKSSGGGSGSNNVIIVHEDLETGILDIKPSDLIDNNKNYLDKYCILKNINDTGMTLLPELGLMVDESNDMILIGFGTETSPVTYTASISEDSYFIRSLSH